MSPATSVVCGDRDVHCVLLVVGRYAWKLISLKFKTEHTPKTWNKMPVYFPDSANKEKHIYRPPTKLREGNVFSHVCPSFCPQMGGGARRGVPCDQYSWCFGPHHTGTPQPCPQTCSKLIQLGPHCTGPAPGHVQTCSLWSKQWAVYILLEWFLAIKMVSFEVYISKMSLSHVSYLLLVKKKINAFE